METYFPLIGHLFLHGVICVQNPAVWLLFDSEMISSSKCESHVGEPHHSFEKDSCPSKALSAISEREDVISVVMLNSVSSDNSLLMVAEVLWVVVRAPRRGGLPRARCHEGIYSTGSVAFTGVTGKAS